MNITALKDYLKKNLTAKRYEHTLGVLETTETLCREQGIDINKGQIAALLHDIARELPESELLELAEEDPYKIEPWEAANPVLLHGRASAVLSRKLFGVEDPEIEDALISHTTGRVGMGSLAKVLFIADYIEPGREHVTEEYRRDLKNLDLDSQMIKILSDLIMYIQSRGLLIVPPSIELLEDLKGLRGVN